MTKRGRPRTRSDGPDRGTPELQARRAFLACGGDPAMTDNPLGAMLAYGKLDVAGSGWRARSRELGAARHEAGRLFSEARNILFGMPGAPAAPMEPHIKGVVADALDDATVIRIRQRYEAAQRTLTHAGHHCRSEVVNIAVYGNWPEHHSLEFGVMTVDELFSHPCRRRHEALLAGLDALAEEYGLPLRWRAA